MGGVGGVGGAGGALVTDVVVILPGSVCLDLLATRWNVADLNSFMLNFPTSVPAPVLHLRRDASPSNDLSWLLVGANFEGKPLVGGCNLAWDPNQHFDFDTSDNIKGEAGRLRDALRVAQEVSELTAQGTILKLFVEFLSHTCATEAKLPFGVVLGYVAMAGLRTSKHLHQTATARMEYIMPCDVDGTCALTGMVSTGPRA